jgi:hypothetical protein
LYDILVDVEEEWDEFSIVISNIFGFELVVAMIFVVLVNGIDSVVKIVCLNGFSLVAICSKVVMTNDRAIVVLESVCSIDVEGVSAIIS